MLRRTGRRVPARARELRPARPPPRVTGCDGERTGAAERLVRGRRPTAVVDRLAMDGYGLVGGIGEYERAWRMAYVRGPEGIIVSLAERIG